MTAEPAPSDVPLIHVEDEEIVIEHHFEDWIAIALFWTLAFIVFLQFFTRYVLNDSLAWTEEIARYNLMWVVFIGGALVTRRNRHIAVELAWNLLPDGPARRFLILFVDLVKLFFFALLTVFGVQITERMQHQPMTVIDVPMAVVYGGITVGCALMLMRQALGLWRDIRAGFRTPPPVV